MRNIEEELKKAKEILNNNPVLEYSPGDLRRMGTLNPGHKMNYHSHEKCDEVWTVISGEGYTIVDGVKRHVRSGNVVTMSAGCKHTVIAGNTGLQLIEVQLGRDISVSDKIKYEMSL